MDASTHGYWQDAEVRMGHVPTLLRSSYATEEQKNMVCMPPNPPPEVQRGNVHRLRRSFQYAVDAVTKQGLNAQEAQEFATKPESAAHSLTGWYQQGSGGGMNSVTPSAKSIEVQLVPHALNLRSSGHSSEA